MIPVHGFGGPFAQLGHVDGVAAFAQQQRFALRRQYFAFAFGAYADDAPCAWLAVHVWFDAPVHFDELAEESACVRRLAQPCEAGLHSGDEELPAVAPHGSRVAPSVLQQ